MKRAIPAFVLAFLAFVCFILVTVTAPFIKSLYLASVTSTRDGSLGLNLGVFGTCYPGRATMLGITISNQACSNPTFPYSLPPAFFGYNETTASNFNPLSDGFMDNTANNIVSGIGKALILNPISAAFALLAFIPSLISICTTWRFTQIMAWIFLLLATICSWVAFLVNIIFAALVRSRVKDETKGNYAGKFGNAVWISLAGAILMTFAMILALFGSCCCVKRKKVVEPTPTHDLENGALEGTRGDELHDVSSTEKAHEELTAVPPKKKFGLPWGKKTHAV